MPSAVILEKKKKFVEELANKIKDSNIGVVVSYKGINVSTVVKLRKEIREANAEYFVVKNSMLRLASKEAGFETPEFADCLKGSTAFVLSSNEDPVSVFKILSNYSKDLKDSTEFAIKVGFLGEKILDSATIKQIGSLPSREQLLGMLVNVLSAPMRGLAVALNALAEKNSEA